MSLSQIIGGVTNVVNTEVVQPLIAIADILQDRSALGASFSRGYGAEFEDSAEQHYATLRVYDFSTSTYILDIEYLLLQSISEAYIERMSPMYTLGQSLMLTSGSSAQRFGYQGAILVNKVDGDNRARMAQAYKDVLRATQLVTGTNKIVELRYRDQIRTGYIMDMSSQMDASHPNRIGVTFTMFVVSDTSPVGNSVV